jgi:hypothetical protein
MTTRHEIAKLRGTEPVTKKPITIIDLHVRTIGTS